MTTEPAEGSLPARPVSDSDRQNSIYRVQQALANDQLEFAEVDDRFDAIFRAQTRADLDAALRDLPEPAQPPPPSPQRHLAPTSNFVLIGDLKIGGWMDFGPELTATTVIGELLIDVSSASLPPEGLTINARMLIGDIKVILPDGARVQSNLTTLIGSRKEVVVEPLPGGPTIRINAFGLIGDTSIYSLSAVPEGKLRKAWAALRRSLSSRNTANELT